MRLAIQKAIASTHPGAQTLAAFVEATVAFALHDWQRLHLCPILERLRTETGLRILLSAPPQFGKSVLTSQRLPAYLIGHNPTTRIGLACYNQTHATNFGAVVRDLMASAQYAEMFPASSLGKGEAAGEFFTGPRKALNDAQPSFKAIGLQSGYVGRGFDTLIIDDPYKSAADASSELVNGSVWRWWDATARPRIKMTTNIIVMYHPYTDDDLAARLEKEGGWLKCRFPAIMDENEDGSDPTGRAVGEVLSPMRTLAELEGEKARSPIIFAAQFQGKPSSAVGTFFTGELKGVARPTDIVARCRAWDIASSPGRGDYTAGVDMGRRANGRFVILHVVLTQSGPDDVDEKIVNSAAADGRQTKIHIAQDPGSAGVRDAAALGKKLAGYAVVVERVSGSKESRARAFASQVNLGNVDIVESEEIVATGPYQGMTVTTAFRKMLTGFPHSTAKKDGVDAGSDTFNELTNASTGEAATGSQTRDLPQSMNTGYPDHAHLPQ